MAHADENWLIENSMLHQARRQARRYAGSGRLWQNPYGESRPRAAAALASVWFTAYPAAVITAASESVIEALGHEALWQALAAIGIQGIHMGPTKRSGGLSGHEYTPTIDGNFDRISFAIDPAFGTLDQFLAMSRTVAAHHAVLIDDIIPGHTGKGADFRLA
ncbi:MAG TPA: hypothetical protein PKA05_16035, partial [Roseiflexaceae bacterium]|nr:hypothetical protein [Roseiflexaceae bacterium]